MSYHEGDNMKDTHSFLIVEDSELLQRMYRLLLLQYSPRGDSIFQAFNAGDAMKILNSQTPIDFVILDTTLPDMHGFDFLRQFRGFESRKNTPVIIITTEGKAEDIEAGLKAGANVYMTKPFKPSEFYKNLERLA